MNLFTNLYNLTSSQYKYIFTYVYIYSHLLIMILFMNALLCLNLTYLIAEPKPKFEFGAFVK